MSRGRAAAPPAVCRGAVVCDPPVARICGPCRVIPMRPVGLQTMGSGPPVHARRCGCSLQDGGGGRTRTYEGIASGFTVRPLCRSGHSPKSRRTVLISKDNRVRPPAGQVVSVLCGRYPRQVNGAPPRVTANEKSRRWERRLFSTATCGDTRYTTLWSIRQNRTVPALRSASPSVSTLRLNYFKCC